jgi:uncharacterized protein YabN with tetrapyrrole methylase and pyrophosphatase domain
VNANRMPYDIAVVGLGIAGIHQITREAEETIRRCKKTFVTDMAVGVVDYLKTLSPSVVDLSSRYKVGTHRIQIYRQMASEVVAAAIDDPPVCFATYGHPKMYSYPTTLIQRAARVLDLRTTILAGLSSVDTLLAELGVDPGFDGLQIYEATDVLVRHRPLQIDASCLILQAPIVLDAYNRPGVRSAQNLKLLQDYLAKYYPLDHEVVLVTSKTHPLLETIMYRTTLDKLALALQRGSNVATLFIPPLRHRPVADQQLADRMKLPASEAPKPTPKVKRRSGRPAIGPQPR